MELYETGISNRLIIDVSVMKEQRSLYLACRASGVTICNTTRRLFTKCDGQRCRSCMMLHGQARCNLITRDMFCNVLCRMF